MTTTEMLRDVSRKEAARITGHSQAFLAAHWDEIPTATHIGDRYWVSLVGLDEWQHARAAK